MRDRKLLRLGCLAALLLAGCIRAGGHIPADAGVDQALSADGKIDVPPPDGPPPDGPPPDAQLPDASLPDAPLPDASQVLLSDDFQDNKLDPALWSYWRVAFAEQGGRLTALPQARAGFNYGHWGHGRGAAVMTHIGDKSWTDYRIDVEMANTGVDSAFNPHSLTMCYRTMGIHFRIEDQVESWNSPQRSCYQLSLQLATCDTLVQGNYGLGRSNGYWIPGTGWSATHIGTSTSLNVGGNSPHITSSVNRVVIDVQGSRIQVWVRTTTGVLHQIIDVKDASPTALSHGGIGVTWGYESLGWIEYIKVTKL